MQTAQLSKKMIGTICVLAAVSMAASALYYRSSACLPFILGVVLGSAASVANVVLLRRSVDRVTATEKKPASGYVQLQHLLRLSLMGAVLVLAALVPAISLWGAAAGVMAYQIAIYSIKLTAKL